MHPAGTRSKIQAFKNDNPSVYRKALPSAFRIHRRQLSGDVDLRTKRNAGEKTGEMILFNGAEGISDYVLRGEFKQLSFPLTPSVQTDLVILPALSPFLRLFYAGQKRSLR